jgi:hypothetical protein
MSDHPQSPDSSATKSSFPPGDIDWDAAPFGPLAALAHDLGLKLVPSESEGELLTGDLDDIDQLASQWRAELSGLVAAATGKAGDVRLIAYSASGPTRGPSPDGVDLADDVASMLGIYPHVSWSVDGSELVVAIVPDPDAATDRSGSLVIAALGSEFTMLSAALLDRGYTCHTCRLSVGDPSLVCQIVVGQFAE